MTKTGSDHVGAAPTVHFRANLPYFDEETLQGIAGKSPNPLADITWRLSRSLSKKCFQL